MHKLEDKKYQKELLSCNTIVVQLRGQIIATNLKIDAVTQAGGLRGKLCMQWLPFCDNLYIVGEATNMQDLGKHLNLKG
jgi:hypothetical protein